MRTIGIFSLKDDLHALAVQHALRSRGVWCHVFETDALIRRGRLNWRPGGPAGGDGQLCDREGAMVEVGSLDAIWWRRSGFPQQAPPAHLNASDRALVDHEWQYAVWGMAESTFGGVWVNEPLANRRAENKLVQLEAAMAVGLAIPRTLVSADPKSIREFVATCGSDGAVVKVVRGSRQRFLRTVRVALADVGDESLGLCPAIYQAYVPGDRHLRTCVFGDDVVAFETRNGDVDSRDDIGAPIREIDLDAGLAERLLRYCRRLRLRMAIMDLKVPPAGPPVWLEANPQGQFLYAQGLTGVDLTARFAEFLMTCAATAQSMEAGSSPSLAAAAG
jgi:glutathione synthase/RimK-type ligase-like ATP-grasp enzyme